MLAEFVASLNQLTKEATGARNKVHFEKMEGLGKNQVMKVSANGECEVLMLDPSPRLHHLESVAEIGPFVKYCIETLQSKPTVWMSPSNVQIILTDGPESTLESRAMIELSRTKQFGLLQDWEDDEPARFTHPRFLKMLRRTFATNILNLRDLLEKLKKIHMQDGRSLTSEATRTRASVGTEIIKELKLTSDEIPEEVPGMSVVAYDDAALPLKMQIRVALDIEEDGSFALIPLAGECKGIVDTTMVALRELIAKEVPETVPVIYGTP